MMLYNDAEDSTDAIITSAHIISMDCNSTFFYLDFQLSKSTV